MTGRGKKTNIVDALCADSLLRQPKRRNTKRQIREPSVPRILIVEDDVILGLDLKMTLIDAGFLTTGPITTMDAAMQIARTQQIDAAILDLHLSGQDVYPLASILNERHIPFMFYTGCVLADALKLYFPLNPVCIKPQTTRQLMTVLAGMLSSPD